MECLQKKKKEKKKRPLAVDWDLIAQLVELCFCVCILASPIQADTNLLTHTKLKPVFIHPYKSTALAVSDQHSWWVQGTALAVKGQHHCGSKGQT